MQLFEETMTAYDAAVAAAKENALAEGIDPEPIPEPELSDVALLGGKARELLADGLPVCVCARDGKQCVCM